MININTHKEKQHIKLIKSALTTLGLNTECTVNTKETKWCRWFRSPSKQTHLKSNLVCNASFCYKKKVKNCAGDEVG